MSASSLTPLQLVEVPEFIETLEKGLVIRYLFSVHQTGLVESVTAIILGYKNEGGGVRRRLFWLETNLYYNSPGISHFHLAEKAEHGHETLLDILGQWNEKGAREWPWWRSFISPLPFVGTLLDMRNRDDRWQNMVASSPELRLYHGMLIERIAQLNGAVNNTAAHDNGLLKRAEALQLLSRRFIGFISKMQQENLRKFLDMNTPVH
jgi:hypothetical protein